MSERAAIWRALDSLFELKGQGSAWEQYDDPSKAIRFITDYIAGEEKEAEKAERAAARASEDSWSSQERAAVDAAIERRQSEAEAPWRQRLAAAEAREAVLAEALRDLRAYVVAHVDVWASVVERADAALSALPASARALLDMWEAARKIVEHDERAKSGRPLGMREGQNLRDDLRAALARLDAEPKP